MARKRNQSLAQMSLSWVLKDPRITSVIIGASKPEQVLDSLKCQENIHFSEVELATIDKIVN